MIPPLRERIEAIETFVNLFLNIYNKKYHKNVVISDATLKQFKNYHWSGNVRELKNVIERMVLTSDTDFSHPDYPSDISLPAEKPHAAVVQPYHAEFAATESLLENPGQSLESVYQEQERKKVIEVLLSVNGNKKKAAEILGVSRGKLYKMLGK